MDIKNIKEAGDWIREQTKTKGGMQFLFIVLVVVCCGIILWMGNRQLQDAIAEKKEAQQQVVKVLARESRIKDECIESLRFYVNIINEMRDEVKETVNTVMVVEKQTLKAIQQQNDLIYKATHDEEN